MRGGSGRERMRVREREGESMRMNGRNKETKKMKEYEAEVRSVIIKIEFQSLIQVRTSFSFYYKRYLVSRRFHEKRRVA